MRHGSVEHHVHVAAHPFRESFPGSFKLRAIVAMRRMEPDSELDFFKRIQRAFYAENTDVTDVSVYPEWVRALGVDESDFVRRMTSEEMARAAQNDFAEARRLGVDGFPALLVRIGNRIGALTYGYQPFVKIDATLQSL